MLLMLSCPQAGVKYSDCFKFCWSLVAATCGHFETNYINNFILFKMWLASMKKIILLEKIVLCFCGWWLFQSGLGSHYYHRLRQILYHFSLCYFLKTKRKEPCHSVDWLTASSKSTGNSRSKCGFLVFYHKLNMSIIAPLFPCSQIRRKSLGLFMNKSFPRIGNVTFKTCCFRNKYIRCVCVENPVWPLHVRYVCGWLVGFAQSISLGVLKFQCETIASS